MRPMQAKPRVPNGGTTAPAGKPWAGGQGTGGTSAPKGSNKGPTTGLAGAQKPGWAVAPNKPVSGPTKAGATGGSDSSSAPAWDSAYESAVSNAGYKYNNTLIGIGAKRQALVSEYGLGQDAGSNPYAKGALLEQAYQRANRGALTSYGSNGQLYAGSLQNQLGYNRDNRDHEDNALRASYERALQDLIDAETTAGDLRNSEVGDAGWKRAEAQTNADLTPDYGDGKKKTRKNKGGRGKK